MIKFPYGEADFHYLITNNYFFVDRTAKIHLLEEMGNKLLFLRPRRFGKSLFLSILWNYYDVTRAAEFERLFGHLAIGQNPTPNHNQYLILKWNFSTIDTQGDSDRIRQTLYDHINEAIKNFAVRYKSLLSYQIEINPDNALASLKSTLTAVQTTPYKLYLLVDEYDNFANAVLMAEQWAGEERYQELVKGEGMLKTVFSAVKDGTEGQGLGRLFITGVSPMVMDDITSGFNIADNISLLPEFNNLCGFWENEVAEVLAQIGPHCQLTPEKVQEALMMMRTFYDGYSFTYEAEPRLYNPTLVLYFLKYWQRYCQYPRQILDSNLAMDADKIAYIARLPQGEQIISQALDERHPLTVSQLSDRFGINEMLSHHHSSGYMISLLYYFGVITLSGELSDTGMLKLRIPNLVIRKLYVERIQRLILPDGGSRYEAEQVVKHFYHTGNMQTLCGYIEQHQLRVFDNRDYRWTNELTIKTIFLTLLFNDTNYIMDSEPALNRQYGDLIMLVRPDMRQFQLSDFIIECKYVALGDNKLSRQQVAGMSRGELAALPAVKKALTEASRQLIDYRAILNEVYGSGYLRLRTYAVVAIGYDRLVWQEL